MTHREQNNGGNALGAGNGCGVGGARVGVLGGSRTRPSSPWVAVSSTTGSVRSALVLRRVTSPPGKCRSATRHGLLLTADKLCALSPRLTYRPKLQLDPVESRRKLLGAAVGVLVLATTGCSGSAGAHNSGVFSGVFTGIVVPGKGNCLGTGGQPKCFSRPIGLPGQCVSVATDNFRSSSDLPATVADCQDCWSVVRVFAPSPQLV